MADNDHIDMYAAYGFSPHVAAGGLVFFSGVLGVGPDGQVPADPRQQYDLAFAALDAVLANAGVRKDQLVDLQTFHVRYPENMDAFMAAKSAYLGHIRPAWTAIGIATLGTPESLVEIRAVARQ